MAEVIGFLASIATLAEIVDKAPKLATTFYRLASNRSKHSPTVRSEIQAFASQISLFESMLPVTLSTIQRHADDTSVVAIVGLLQDNQVLRELQFQYEVTMERIGDMKEVLAGLPMGRGWFGLGRVWAGFVWGSYRGEVEAFGAQLGKIEGVVGLVLVIILVENLKAKRGEGEGGEIEEMIKDKEDQIRALTRTVLIQQERIEKLERKVRHWDSTNQISEVFAPPAAIIRISRQVATEISESSTRVGEASSRGTQEVEEKGSERLVPITSPPPRTLSFYDSPPPPRAAPSQAIVPSGHPDSSASDDDDLRVLSASVSRANSIISDYNNPPQKESIYAILNRLGNNVRVDLSGTEHRVGSIHGIYAQATIDPNCLINLISSDYAVDHNLEIHSLPVWFGQLTFSFGFGFQGRCIGNVAFKWGEQKPSERFWTYTSVQLCFVCETMPPSVRPPQLVFGKPFLEAEERRLQDRIREVRP